MTDSSNKASVRAVRMVEQDVFPADVAILAREFVQVRLQASEKDAAGFATLWSCRGACELFVR